MYVNIKVERDKVVIAPQTAIVAGSKNYHIFKAVFSEDWDELDKFVIFPSFNTSVAFDKNNEAVIPEACLVKHGALRFGIYGRSGDGETHVSTNLYELTLLQGVGEGDAIIALPTDEDAVSAWTDYINKIMISAFATAQIGSGQIKDGAVTNAKIANLIDTSATTGATWGYIPYVKTDGGIELGLYADFHLTSADGIDRKARIRIYDDSGTPRFKLEGSSSGSLAHLTVNNLTAEQYHGTYFGTLGYPLVVTLNGTAYTYNANSANATTCQSGLMFFAPTSAGTEGYVLLADENGAPEWADTLPYSTKFKTGSSSSAASLSLSALYNLVTTLANTVSSQAETITDLQNRITALEEEG